MMHGPINISCRLRDVESERISLIRFKTVSQLKICDSSGETFKGFEVLYFSINASKTQLLSSGEFCKLRYDTISVKSAYANVSFYTNNPKMPNFGFVTLLSQMNDMMN